MDRHERARAGGVHCYCRTLEPERERHPPGRRRQQVPRRVVGAALIGLELLNVVEVVGRAHPKKHARPRGLQRRRAHRGRLERLPADLEHQTLLRIEACRLARGDAEELGVEAADVVVQEPGPPRHPVGPLPHQSRRRDLADPVLAGRQRPPEPVRCRPAGGNGRRARPPRPARWRRHGPGPDRPRAGRSVRERAPTAP